MCTVMPMIVSGTKMGSAKGLCNQQDTQRCTSGRIGMDGNSVMTSRMKRRKTMSNTFFTIANMIIGGVAGWLFSTGHLEVGLILFGAVILHVISKATG